MCSVYEQTDCSENFKSRIAQFVGDKVVYAILVERSFIFQENYDIYFVIEDKGLVKALNFYIYHGE